MLELPADVLERHVAEPPTGAVVMWSKSRVCEAFFSHTILLSFETDSNILLLTELNIRDGRQSLWKNRSPTYLGT